MQAMMPVTLWRYGSLNLKLSKARFRDSESRSSVAGKSIPNRNDLFCTHTCASVIVESGIHVRSFVDRHPLREKQFVLPAQDRFSWMCGNKFILSLWFDQHNCINICIVQLFLNQSSLTSSEVRDGLSWGIRNMGKTNCIQEIFNAIDRIEEMNHVAIISPLATKRNLYGKKKTTLLNWPWQQDREEKIFVITMIVRRWKESWLCYFIGKFSSVEVIQLWKFSTPAGLERTLGGGPHIYTTYTAPGEVWGYAEPRSVISLTDQRLPTQS